MRGVFFSCGRHDGLTERGEQLGILFNCSFSACFFVVEERSDSDDMCVAGVTMFDGLALARLAGHVALVTKQSTNKTKPKLQPKPDKVQDSNMIARNRTGGNPPYPSSSPSSMLRETSGSRWQRDEKESPMVSPRQAVLFPKRRAACTQDTSRNGAGTR